MPSLDYRPFYIGFWLKHRVLHLLVTAVMKHPRLQYKEFVRSLKVTSDSSDDVAVTLRMLGRSITDEDLQDDDVVSPNPPSVFFLLYPYLLEIIYPCYVGRAS